MSILDRELLNHLSEALRSLTPFEPYVPGARVAQGDGLSRMTELDALVRASIPKPAPPPVPPVHYESSRADYQPALNDPSLVDALMDYHRQNSPAKKNSGSSGFQVAAPPRAASKPLDRTRARNLTRPGKA